MINRIIEFSANNKILVFALLAAACLWGTWSAFHLPLDALPDLGETQVIVLSRWDRSPDIIEDQVTYPILSAITCERCRESPRSLPSADSHSNTRSMWIPTGCAPMESPSRAWPTPFVKATAKPERGCWNSAAPNI